MHYLKADRPGTYHYGLKPWRHQPSIDKGRRQHQQISKAPARRLLRLGPVLQTRT